MKEPIIIQKIVGTLKINSNSNQEIIIITEIIISLKKALETITDIITMEIMDIIIEQIISKIETIIMIIMVTIKMALIEIITADIINVH